MQSKDDNARPSATAGSNWRRNRTVRVVALVCAIAGALLLSIPLGILPPVSGMVGIAIVLTTVFWLIRAQLPSILLVFVSVLLVSVIVTQRMPKFRADRMKAEEGVRLSTEWQASGRFDQKLPIVLHLVFDEMMSVGAMTDDLPAGTQTRESLLEFGEKHSFRTFDSVYSRYFFSGETLPNLVGPEYDGRMSLKDVFLKQQAVKSNLYFDDMARRGYRTAVFQTALMNYCDNPNVDMCQTFDSFDPGKGENVGLDERNQRASLWQAIFRAYERSYTAAMGQALLGRIYGLQPQGVGMLGVADRYDAQRFPQWFDRFTTFAATVPRGTHVFAHFMVPHSPYLLSESCVVSGRFEGGYYLSKYPEAQRAEKRRGFYEGYFAQLRCVQSKLDDFMEAVGQSENYRDAVIIIHGDHGSRISSGNILEDYTQRDFVDNYATFFAVRSPAVQPGVDCEFVSLPEVFRRNIADGVQSRPRSGQPLPVLVDSRKEKRKVEAKMPLFGCAAGGMAISQ